MTERAVFLDFDGTITARDTFVEIVRQFAPEATARWLPPIVRGEVTLRAGIPAIVEAIASDQLPAMIALAQAAPLRAGLPELLDFLADRNVPVVVVSSGLADLVRGRLGPLAVRFAGIHAMELDRSGPRLRVVAPFAEGDEIVSKPAVLRQYPAVEQVVVGDSITDRRMAAVAQRVFARDRLCGHCDAANIPYQRWEDFHDLRQALAAAWSEPSEATPQTKRRVPA